MSRYHSKSNYLSNARDLELKKKNLINDSRLISFFEKCVDTTRSRRGSRTTRGRRGPLLPLPICHNHPCTHRHRRRRARSYRPLSTRRSSACRDVRLDLCVIEHMQYTCTHWAHHISGARDSPRSTHSRRYPP